MVFAGVFPFSSYGGIDREERKHRKVLFLFKAQQIEKSESGPSFWRVQIWNDRSQKPKKNYGRHPLIETKPNGIWTEYLASPDLEQSLTEIKKELRQAPN
jgi:hypothetical protein